MTSNLYRTALGRAVSGVRVRISSATLLARNVRCSVSRRYLGPRTICERFPVPPQCGQRSPGHRPLRIFSTGVVATRCNRYPRCGGTGSGHRSCAARSSASRAQSETRTPAAIAARSIAARSSGLSRTVNIAAFVDPSGIGGRPRLGFFTSVPRRHLGGRPLTTASSRRSPPSLVSHEACGAYAQVVVRDVKRDRCDVIL